MNRKSGNYNLSLMKRIAAVLIFYLTILMPSFSGVFKIDYKKPSNSVHQKLYKALSNNDAIFLGDAVRFLNKLYDVPNDIQIVVADCGSRNSRYNLGEITIYICYETIQYKVKDYRTPVSTKKEYLSRVFKNSVFTFWHEIGHAMIHQLELPISSGKLNQEDLADEFAVLSMIWRKDDKWTNTIVTSALHYKNRVILAQREGLTRKKYGYHSPDDKRYYNLMCLLYGAKPITFKRLEEKLNDEPFSSSSCKSNYYIRDKYWSEMLKSHTKYQYFD